MPAVVGELLHHGLVKGDVLLGRAVGRSVDAEFAREFLARRQTGIEVQQLQEIDDRALVVAAAILHRRHLGEDRTDVDGTAEPPRGRTGW